MHRLISKALLGVAIAAAAGLALPSPAAADHPSIADEECMRLGHDCGCHPYSSHECEYQEPGEPWTPCGGQPAQVVKNPGDKQCLHMELPV